MGSVRASVWRGVVGALLALFVAVAVTVVVAVDDPVSGVVGGRPVVALHVNQDRDLVDVVVADAAGRVGTVHTTGHHRFWSESDGRWVRADRLGAGDRLDSGDGSVVTVVGSVTAGGLQTMYDLTVDGVHTYYVQAGDHPVLVHNTDNDRCLGGAIESGNYVVSTPVGEYVGQSGNISARLERHVASGKFTKAEVAAAQRFAVEGGKLDREIAEQLLIDSKGGIDDLLNKVNPIGPKRFGVMPNQPYVRVSQ